MSPLAAFLVETLFSALLVCAFIFSSAIATSVWSVTVLGRNGDNRAGSWNPMDQQCVAVGFAYVAASSVVGID